ncbi:MAG: hypothetical protein BM564_05075 [Bacteroidetes bacterium MedPE-SWsnd-G2]|nr:MAG: hypothetical protein BM564_05075 [Bacteroidetes bacterium MedPE-SWsnd-G2]
MILSDHLHRKLELKSPPLRIVSLVPSQTELICDLGLESRLVGVTKFCVHPSHLKKDKTIVGGTKKVNIEKIVALNPDLVLCNKEENTLEIVSQLEKVCQVHVSDVKTVEDNFSLIEDYGKLLGVEGKAEALVLEIKRELSKLKIALKDTPVLKVVYAIWKNPWMACGGDTYISDVLELIKLENRFKRSHRYPEFNLNEINLGDIDFMLLSSEPYPFSKLDQEEITQHINQLKTMLVDGEMFSWYGSRLLKGIPYLLKLRSSLIADIN